MKERQGRWALKKTSRNTGRKDQDARWDQKARQEFLWIQDHVTADASNGIRQYGRDRRGESVHAQPESRWASEQDQYVAVCTRTALIGRRDEAKLKVRGLTQSDSQRASRNHPYEGQENATRQNEPDSGSVREDSVSAKPRGGRR